MGEKTRHERDKERDKITLQVAKMMGKIKRPEGWRPNKKWHRRVYAGAKD